MSRHFRVLQSVHDKIQSLTARIGDSLLGGPKRQLDLGQGIIAAGPPHKRFDERCRATLKLQLPSPGIRQSRCHRRPCRAIDHRDGIRRERGRERRLLHSAPLCILSSRACNCVQHGFLRHVGGSAEPPPDVVCDHPPLTAMRFTCRCACADFGMVTVRTPLRNAAFTLSSSMSSTGMRRSKRP
jgi:hypothetical protein